MRGWRDAFGRSSPTSTAPRSSSPALSPAWDCGDVEGKLQGKLDWLEDSLVDFFSGDPSGVWLARLDSSYDRLLAHAVSQWLGLSSLSPLPPSPSLLSTSRPGGTPGVELEVGGSRQTQVENPRAFFVPPSEALTHFLRRRRSAAPS